ncbi:MAG: HAMP domain-containing protein [Calditrichaeota bacterium]|nr:HAMP domain-containing protein [Calditrichota bacterium]
MKIRLHLTLWYFAVTLLILLIFSAGIYTSMRHLLFRAVDNELRIVVDSIQSSYDPATKKFKIIEKDIEKIDPFTEYYVIIYNVTGEPIYKSPLGQSISLDIPLSNRHVPFEETLKRIVHKSNKWLHPGEKAELAFHGISRKIYYQNRQIGWVTVALSIEGTRKSMAQLVKVILSLILIALAVMAASGYVLTRKALYPVEVMTRKANQISHSNLNQRVEIVHANDELGELAATLNDLLDRLEQAFESQQGFLQDAAHELKTPLSILRAHWESELNNPAVSNEMKEKMIHDIETITRLTHLLNNLLLLSQTEDIRANFSFESISLVALLQDVFEDATTLAELKEQKIELQHLSDVMVNGDRMRLYQLFFNVIENAIKYTAKGGEIMISLSLETGNAIVKIQDNGPGISPQDLPRIFDRFYRVKKNRRQRAGFGNMQNYCGIS